MYELLDAEAVLAQPGEPDHTRVGLARRRLARVAPMLVVVAMVVPVNLLHVARIGTISPIDELMHIDYLVRASGPGFQRMSDVLSQEALHEIACRGHPVDRLPPCGERPYVAEQFTWEGRNLASGHSPYYYIVTGVAARPLRALLPGDSLVTWARVLGSAWLLAGLALTFAAARRLRVPPWAAAPALVLLALSPSTQHASTTVNPDATAVFAGGLVLLTGVRIAQRSTHPLWGVGAGIVAMLFDATNLLIVVAVAGFIVTAAAVRLRLKVAASLALIGGALGGEAGNRLLVSLLGTVDYTANPKDLMFATDSLPGPIVWGESAILAMLPPTKGYMFPALSTPAHATASHVAVLLAIAGLVVCAVAGPRRPGLDRLAAWGLGTLVLGAPFLVVSGYLLGGTYFAIPARYGLSILPVVAIAMAVTLGARVGGRLLMWATSLALAFTAVYALA